jgi:excisionase family DNA binding protein
MSYSIDVYLTPRQVAEKLQLAVDTIYRWLRRGKLRGTRISNKAWRVSELDLASFMKKQNVSELLFEEYLDERKLGAPDHEPVVPGKIKPIDYRLSFNDKTLWFEVKEFADDPAGLLPGGGPYDPYIGIRKKISKAREKFRDYDGECCSLVLYNRAANLVDICTPELALGAMLGNVGVRYPANLEGDSPTWSGAMIFTGGGKLIHPHTKAPQNRTISAVIALERLATGQREFKIKVAQREIAEQRALSWNEFDAFFKSEGPVYEKTALRAIVYENPHAANPLPADIFRGPFDERWGRDGDVIRRVYAGPELTKLEELEHALELDLGPLEKMMRGERTE